MLGGLGRRENLTRNWSRSKFKVQVRVRPELAFHWKLLLASSHLQAGLHNLWGPGQRGDVRFHVQKSFRILRHGLRRSHPCRSHSPEAVSAPSSPLFQTHTWDISELEHRLERGKRDVSPVCPICNFFHAFSKLLGEGWTGQDSTEAASCQWVLQGSWGLSASPREHGGWKPTCGWPYTPVLCLQEAQKKELCSLCYLRLDGWLSLHPKFTGDLTQTTISQEDTVRPRR